MAMTMMATTETTTPAKGEATWKPSLHSEESIHEREISTKKRANFEGAFL